MLGCLDGLLDLRTRAICTDPHREGVQVRRRNPTESRARGGQSHRGETEVARHSDYIRAHRDRLHRIDEIKQEAVRSDDCFEGLKEEATTVRSQRRQ